MLRNVDRALVRHGVRLRDEITLPRQFPHHRFRPRGSLGSRGLRLVLEWCY